MAATAPNGNDGMILVLGLAAIWFITTKAKAAPRTGVATGAQAGGAQRSGVVPTTPTTAVNLLGQAINRLIFPVSMAGATGGINPGQGMTMPDVGFGASVIDSGISTLWGNSLGFDMYAPDDTGVPLLSGSQTTDAFNWDSSLSFG